MGTIFVIALEGIANPIPKNVCVPDSIAVSTDSTSLHIVYLLIQVVVVRYESASYNGGLYY